MKRFVFSQMLIVIILSALPATSTKTITAFQSKEIQLQAGYGNVLELVVTPLPAQANSYMQGMPFSIEEQYVQYDYTKGAGVTENGREIATWSIITNSEFKLSAKAEPMRPVGLSEDALAKAEDLHYKLTFFYTLGYALADGTNVTLQNKSFTVQSNVEDTSNKIIIDTDTPDTQNAYIGTANGTIFFQFQESASRLIENANLNPNTYLEKVPYGDYEAIVTLTITPIEGGST